MSSWRALLGLSVFWGVRVCVCEGRRPRVCVARRAESWRATDLGILDYSQHLDRPKLLELSSQLVLGRFTAQPPDE